MRPHSEAAFQPRPHSEAKSQFHFIVAGDENGLVASVTNMMRALRLPMLAPTDLPRK